MSNKWDDYTKVLAIIQSCTTSRHQIIAFHVLMNFDKKWKDRELAGHLHDALDDNLLEMLRRNGK